MKEFMNKYFSKSFSILTSVIGLAIVVASAVLLGLSVEVWADEYGTDISLNKDYIIFIIIGLGLLIGGIYASLKAFKEESVKGSLVVSYGFGSAMLTFYSLALIIKLAQKTLENKLAQITPYIIYLVIGLLVFSLVCYVYYYLTKKENRE